jgi:uroporphyrinogen III methyltransferase/synthase
MLLGAEPVELPTTQVVPATDPGPLDAAIDALRRVPQPADPESTKGRNLTYDWLFFNSANSASFFLRRLFVVGHDVRILGGAKLAARDRATAEALLGYGLVADFIPADETGSDTTKLGNLAEQRVLLLCSSAEVSPPAAQPGLVAEGPSAGLVSALREQGARVEVVLACASQPADPDPVVLSELAAGRLDMAIFASSSSVLSLAKMLSERPVAEVLSSLIVACISPAVADAAQAQGVRVDLVAKEPTIEGLVDALTSWRLKQGRP